MNQYTRPTMSFRIAIMSCTLAALTVLGCRDKLNTSGTREPMPQHENVPLQSHVVPESYRFDTRLSDARVSAAPAADDSTFVFRFDFAEGGAPWTLSDGEAFCAIQDGALMLSTDSLTRCDSPNLPGVAAMSVKAIFIRARVSGCSRFTFAFRGEDGEFSTKNEALVDVAPSEDWVQYHIDTTFLATWNSHLGNVGQLRLILPENATMEIQSIGLARRVDRFAGKAYGRMQYSRGKRDHVQSMFARTPASLEYDVTVMPNARLTTEFFNPGAMSTLYRILLKDGPDETVLVEKQTDNTNRPHDVTADLSRWAGKNVQIRFEAESQEPGKVAMWLNPALARSFPVTETKRPMNVIWHVTCNLRPSNMSVYGYERETTPEMDAVAKEGVLFDRCFSPGSWTVDSVASFLTGMSPNAHGMLRIHPTLPESMPVLPEILRNAGYFTGLFSQNPYVGKRSGYTRGFDEAYRFRVRGAGVKERTADSYPLNVAIAKFLKKHREHPQFLYVHTIEPHGPYIPPGSLRVFAQPDGSVRKMELYDDCILWCDANLGHLIRTLKEEGLWNNTLLIVTADHGQSFPEVDNGLEGHGEAPHFSRVWIPLIMRLPGFIPEGVTVQENVQALEIPRTLLDLLQIEPQPQFEGISLLSLFDGTRKDEFARRTIFSTGQRIEWQAAVKDQWFFLDKAGQGELLDLHTVVREGESVIQDHPEVAQELLKATQEFRESERVKADKYTVETADSMMFDLETRKELEDLGYGGDE